MFELGCVVHSVIIGIALGIKDSNFPLARCVAAADELLLTQNCYIFTDTFQRMGCKAMMMTKWISRTMMTCIMLEIF